MSSWEGLPSLHLLLCWAAGLLSRAAYFVNGKTCTSLKGKVLLADETADFFFREIWAAFLLSSANFSQ